MGGHATAPDKQILAGVEVTRRGQPRPTAAGRLCLWRHEMTDRRADSSFETFEKYRNKLKMRCENGSEPAILQVTPNSSWPDVVYYHSYVQPSMGSRIHIVDNLYGTHNSLTNSCNSVVLVSYLFITVTSLFISLSVT